MRMLPQCQITQLLDPTIIKSDPSEGAILKGITLKSSIIEGVSGITGTLLAASPNTSIPVIGVRSGTWGPATPINTTKAPMKRGGARLSYSSESCETGDGWFFQELLYLLKVIFIQPPSHGGALGR